MLQAQPTSLSLDLYRELLRIRMIETEIGERYKEQKMRCPTHLSIGQEAIAVGVGKNLRPEDYLVSNHRAHAHYLAKGGDLKRMMAELYGKATGCTRGKGGSMHLIDLSKNIIGTTPIVGGSYPVGIGVAFSSKLKNENALTAIYFGEASTEEGVWAEGLNFASLKDLPILFVSENNFYSCYSPMEVRQSEKRSRLEIAKAHGIQTFSGNGNDQEEVYEVAKKATQYIREGNGPCLIEFETYRYREHCGPNVDPDGYRPKEEEDYWYNRCPVDLYTKKLSERGELTESLVEQYKEEIKKEIDDAFAFAEASPFPTYIENENLYKEQS
ncbi:MAG: Acetoin:2,6-dichlorophenolindophenol oxidoreductase subunit alpha [Chlamydiia bacterium]|nr:Acetoin:2,6-dichlorophenolindophenol oxidoreductase subunit alpha [Chlamydiia bacterium]MCH9616423.1 Acetoin:2,6-dichlorophenolindophenol oxidoreductase subunit alpha [Chlamydiia bacterium]MCH9629591.1 Acetoin:2,6-dichlorophenolindophenol oxidoreductase subunit alpha [Chlamydiia bacterium]